MLAWWESQGEGNTQVLSPQRASVQSEPQMDEHGKSALAVPEIGHVTKRMAGDSPSMLSHHKINSFPSLLAVFLVWMINYVVTLVLRYIFP